MSLSFVSHRQQQCRIGHVTNFIGDSLDASVSLDDLANVAHLSPAHLVRFYTQKVGEAPMQTLRRLRLRRAFADIGLCNFARITDVGFAAGYGSSAAFTHAFRKQFGFAPTEVPLLIPATASLPPLRLEHLPERKVRQFSYSGAYGENGYFKARMNWLCHVAERDHLLTWRINDRDYPFSEKRQQQVQLTHFVPVSDNAMQMPEADLSTHPAGLYAVIEVAPTERLGLLEMLAQRVREELGCQLIEGCTMDRDIHVRAYRAQQERRIEVYVPVAPMSRRGEQLRDVAEANARRKF